MAQVNDGSVSIPKWFLAICGTMATVVAGSAVAIAGWAYSISTTVAIISTKLDSAIATASAETRHVSERVTRNEAKLEQLDSRVRTLETKATK